jgi:GMP synthase-like glutamine amidotransferase
MHIAILVTNTDISDFAARHPPEEARFTAMMRLVRPDWQFSAFDVVRGPPPTLPNAFDGYIITGSPASANDPDAWIARLKGFIRQAHLARVPQFGACFGHQVIAAALGGQVEPAPGGWRLGLYRGPASLGFQDSGEPIRLYAAHKDQVTALPPGATLLGGTDDCPIGAYQVGPAVFATQYHPEMPQDFIADLVEETAEEVGSDVAELARASLAQGTAEMERFARGVAAFFEQTRQAS